MKKSYKIVILLIISLIIMLALSSISMAAKVSIDNIKDNEANVATSGIKNIGSIILSGITGVGIVISVVMVAVLGVKYMMGSAEERAEYKKSMLPYLIGAILLFGASAIANMVVNLVK